MCPMCLCVKKKKNTYLLLTYHKVIKMRVICGELTHSRKRNKK
jgi:hypothetical protein